MDQVAQAPAVPAHSEFDVVKAADASDTPVGPRYSYADYKPAPKLVYARHEAEANRLVETLHG